jgi:hypothetical protein
VFIMVAALLYVFGTMYMTNKDQAGGGGSSSSNTSGDTAQGGSTKNSTSPGNNGPSGQQSTGANQTAIPTGATQENFVPESQQQTALIPTQPIIAPRQTSGGSTGTAAISTQQQSQNNSATNSQPQLTPNPMGRM